MRPNTFPVRYYAHDNGHFVTSPDLALSVWHRLRMDPNKWPTGLTWYAVDMEVLSPNSIRLFVYDMKDSFRGGIGKKIHEEAVTEFTPAELKMLEKLVLSIYTSLAEDELERREKRQREMQIINLRKEMFGV